MYFTGYTISHLTNQIQIFLIEDENRRGHWSRKVKH